MTVEVHPDPNGTGGGGATDLVIGDWSGNATIPATELLTLDLSAETATVVGDNIVCDETGITLQPGLYTLALNFDGTALSGTVPVHAEFLLKKNGTPALVYSYDFPDSDPGGTTACLNLAINATVETLVTIDATNQSETSDLGFNSGYFSVVRLGNALS